MSRHRSVRHLPLCSARVAARVRRFVAGVVRRAAGGVLLAALAGTAGCHHRAPRTLVVRAGRLIDGTGAPAQTGRRLIIHDGVIQSIVPDTGPVPAGTAVLDARQLTVLPGLVNAHVHLFSSPACTPGRGAGLMQAVRNLHGLLAAGETTVADLGAPVEAAIGLRRYVGTARSRGPRVLVAGPIITAPKGYPLELVGAKGVREGLARYVGSPAAGRAAVRSLVDAGVDLIKVAVQERSYNGKPIPMLQGPTLCAVVDEAHRQELRVFAHAITLQGYRAALDCGVDVLAHGALVPLPKDLVARLASRQTVVLPTHFVFEAFLWGPHHMQILDQPRIRPLITATVRRDLKAYAKAFDAGGPNLPPVIEPGISRAELAAGVRADRANTAALHAAGVPLGFGTDGALCFNILGRPVAELRRFVQAGLTPLQALHVATEGGARALGLQDALGTLKPGYRADLIAVAGAPDQHIDAISDVRDVVIDGVRQHLQPASWLDAALLGGRVLATKWFH